MSSSLRLQCRLLEPSPKAQNDRFIALHFFTDGFRQSHLQYRVDEGRREYDLNTANRVCGLLTHLFSSGLLVETLAINANP
jgi:hypothetical protein